jgi:DNA (cytosine-5)-methyltransferase 1
LNVLDLFSGIGGFSLGLERAGMRTVAFCEIDPYCRRVLARHWPDVPVYDDVRTLTAATLGITKGDGRGAGRQGRPDPASAWQQQPNQPLQIDVICGGFPCQDISNAGKGAGITGERSGLWKEYARIIGEVRPLYVIVENVAALLHRGLADVLGDLSTLGYDAEWHCIRASDVGAPHRRDRVWIIAYPQHSDTDSERSHRAPQHVDGDAEFCDEQERQFGSLGEVLADAISERGRSGDDQRQDAIYAYSCGEAIRSGEYGGWWATEPDVGRVAHGVPARVDRLRSLGNAVVPQIPELIGRAIMKVAEPS